MPAIVEIFLDRIRVVENGREDEQSGVNALAATLYHPRENVPSVTAVRMLQTDLADNANIDMSRMPLHQRLLFKEVLRGTCTLELTLSVATEARKLDTFLHRALGTAWAAGVGAVTGGLGALPAALVSQASVSLFEMAQPEDEITIIGQGRFPLAENMTRTRIPVQLALPLPLATEKIVVRDGRRMRVTRTYPAGFGNAEVAIRVNRIELD